MVEIEAGRFEDAYAAYHHALESVPDYSYTHFNIGMTYTSSCPASISGTRAERDLLRDTAMKWETALKRFIDVNGDLPVNLITKAHCVKYKDALMQYPATVPNAWSRCRCPSCCSG